MIPQFIIAHACLQRFNKFVLTRNVLFLEYFHSACSNTEYFSHLHSLTHVKGEVILFVCVCVCIHEGNNADIYTCPTSSSVLLHKRSLFIEQLSVRSGALISQIAKENGGILIFQSIFKQNMLFLFF